MVVPVSSPRGEITCRVYTPEGTGPFPVHVNMHGGMYIVPARKVVLALAPVRRSQELK